MRTAITLAALLFCCGLGFLTVYVILSSGLDVLTGVSLIVLVLMTLGILGALTEPPDRRR